MTMTNRPVTQKRREVHVGPLVTYSDEYCTLQWQYTGVVCLEIEICI